MLLYHRPYTYFLYKLLIICKYLNKHLEKNFIKANKFSTTVSILLTYKLRKDIYIYVNYKDLNNIIIKNHYLIPLIYKTFDILYYIKIYNINDKRARQTNERNKRTRYFFVQYTFIALFFQLLHKKK